MQLLEVTPRKHRRSGNSQSRTWHIPTCAPLFVKRANTEHSYDALPFVPVADRQCPQLRNPPNVFLLIETRRGKRHRWGRWTIAASAIRTIQFACAHRV